VIEHSLFPVPKAVQAPRSVPVTGRAAAFLVFDTELQIEFSMERPSVDCQGLVLGGEEAVRKRCPRMPQAIGLCQFAAISA
jgi:hypothetical protein